MCPRSLWLARCASVLIAVLASASGCQRVVTGPAAAKPVLAAPLPTTTVSAVAPLNDRKPLPVATCEEPCRQCVVLDATNASMPASRNTTPAEDAILADVFQRYLRSDECQADPEHADPDQLDPAEDMRSVSLVVDGSFTAPHLRQTIITFFMGHCGVMGHHAEGWGKAVMVLLEAGKAILVTENELAGASQAKLVDLEGDGVDELLASFADYGSGTTFSSSAVLSLAGGSMTSLAHFEMSRRSCFGEAENQEFFESELYGYRDPKRGSLCLLQRRHELSCPPP